MPTTRKKVIKTVYKDEDSEEETGDFSDSGSEAQISEESSSEEEEDAGCDESSSEEFTEKPKTKHKKLPLPVGKPTKIKFAKTFLNKINKQNMLVGNENEDVDVAPALFSVKDLTDADKLLPSVLNLSESDSSDDECEKLPLKKNITKEVFDIQQDDYSDNNDEIKIEYKDVWSNNIQDNSDEIAKKTFMELQLHKAKIEETKASLEKYLPKEEIKQESDVQDLLAQGEDVVPQETHVKKKPKLKRYKGDSESDVEDWEEVKESKSIPQQGLQLIVEIPDAFCRKKKKIDVEMMMKRKMNRVKKEYQVYMHKVHVLCWLGHGNFISRVLNDQELMAAALSLVPSKNCYPEDRVDVKYVEQITTWYKDKLSLKQDKHENKFRPKALPLKTVLLEQMQNRAVTTRKYLVFIFVVMLRALGLQCRIMFNFVALPIKPPSSELCSLSTKPKLDKNNDKQENLEQKKQIKKRSNLSKDTKMKSKSQNISQVDGNEDCMTDSDYEHLMQVDGSNDVLTVKKTRSTRSTRANNSKSNEEDVSPPKRARKDLNTSKVNKKQDDAKSPQKIENTKNNVVVSESISNNNTKNNIVNINKPSPKSLSLSRRRKPANDNIQNDKSITESGLKIIEQSVGSRRTRNRINKKVADSDKSVKSNVNTENQLNPPTILITNENQINVPSKYFDNMQQDKEGNKGKPSRKRSNTSESAIVKEIDEKQKDIKSRTKSAPGNVIEKSKYFTDDVKKGKLSRKRLNTSESAIVKELDDRQKDIKIKSRTKSAPGNVVEKNKYDDDLNNTKKPKLSTRQSKRNQEISEDKQRVSHRDIAGKIKAKSKNDVTEDLVNIIKNRIKDAKSKAKQGIVKGKIKNESDEDSDHLPIEDPKHKSESEDEFKPTKVSPKPSTSRKIDRRILSTDDESLNKKNDVWCEVFVEELEQWISVDVVQGKVHCNNEIYNRATHPICYIVGWDNNNYLKDLTRRYVPHWNTVTRKLRAEPVWWSTALQPWLGPKTARDKEEDEYLDRMQLEAPLPKSIAEYKNHPLYALKRHLLKFEAIYPPDAATLGFVRGEAVYARRCVHVCRSRDTWLKEAKVVRLGEQPYKVVKARPKWDKLSNKLITDKPLEVFGPWQVQDYEPPVAENGLVPRNAYGNVELFKDCMLPKGTVHIKLPGLNKVARKLNIDCAPAMTGFDFNGGWSHPVYDGFVVCKEFEQVITEAWLEDQEEQERKEREKTELRVYGNWKRLIKGLLIRERLKLKYGFEEPSTSQTNNKKSKGPRLVVKKKS